MVHRNCPVCTPASCTVGPNSDVGRTPRFGIDNVPSTIKPPTSFTDIEASPASPYQSQAAQVTPEPYPPLAPGGWYRLRLDHIERLCRIEHHPHPQRIRDKWRQYREYKKHPTHFISRHWHGYVHRRHGPGAPRRSRARITLLAVPPGRNAAHQARRNQSVAMSLREF